MISIYVNNTPAVNKFVSPKGNQVTVNFNQPIILDPSKKYQMRCLSADIVYCMSNIFTGVNDTLHYAIFDSTGHSTLSRDITFEAGLYSLKDINRTISIFTSDPSNGNDSKLIVFSADTATSKIYVTFSQPNVGILISFDAYFLKMLGFHESQGHTAVQGRVGDLYIGILSSKGSVKSVNPAQLNSIQNILIKCDAVTGSYQNTQMSNIIASITPNVSPYSNISWSPYHPLRIPLNIHRIDRMTLTLVDENDNEIDMGSSNGTSTPEKWSVQLDISPVELARIL